MANNRIVELAEKEIGYSEIPANSNTTKYGEWFGVNRVPWCAVFVSWLYFKAGTPLGNIGYLKGFAGCQTGFAYFKEHDCITKTPVAGDIVLFDWQGDGRYDHTGIFVKWLTDKTFETIEGNTSYKNQSNGGSVMRRVRGVDTAIFVHPKVTAHV